MPRTTGIVLSYLKCIRPAGEDAWGEWYDDVHLPDLLSTGAVRVVTRWELTPRPEPGMPGIGFTHVTIFELAGDVREQLNRLVAKGMQLREQGRMHRDHVLIDAHSFVAHGRWNDKPEPSPDLRGHILAYVLCNDPAREAEWDEWYDREHVPDMMASGAFAAATRWERLDRAAYGANHITLYDVAHASVDTAVELSAAVLPGIVAAGRKHPCHAGAMTLTLRPAGRHGGAGLRRYE